VNGEVEAPILIIDQINWFRKSFKQVDNLTHFGSSIPYKGFHHYVQNGILHKNGWKSYRDAYTLRISFLRQNGNVIKTKSETPQEVGSFLLSFKIIRFSYK
jgi:hypothetical protein